MRLSTHGPYALPHPLLVPCLHIHACTLYHARSRAWVAWLCPDGRERRWGSQCVVLIWNHEHSWESHCIPLCHFKAKVPLVSHAHWVMGWPQQWCWKGPIAALSMRMSWGISWPTLVQLLGLHDVHHASRKTCPGTKAAVNFFVLVEVKLFLWKTVIACT